MERQIWNFDRIGTELKFVLIQLAGILYGSFAKHFSPLMSLLCLIALLSMHAFCNEGIVHWSELRVARGWTLCDLLLTKLGEVILLSVAVSWQQSRLFPAFYECIGYVMCLLRKKYCLPATIPTSFTPC